MLLKETCDKRSQKLSRWRQLIIPSYLTILIFMASLADKFVIQMNCLIKKYEIAI